MITPAALAELDRVLCELDGLRPDGPPALVVAAAVENLEPVAPVPEPVPVPTPVVRYGPVRLMLFGYGRNR